MQPSTNTYEIDYPFNVGSLDKRVKFVKNKNY